MELDLPRYIRGRIPDRQTGKSLDSAAADLPPLREEQLAAVREIYERSIREHVHSRW